LVLSADPNWPDERLVPSPDLLEDDLKHWLGARIVVRTQKRAYNPTATGKRFYEIEAEHPIPGIEVGKALLRRIGRLRDRSFLGVPIRVILCTSDGEFVSKGTAHPGPHR
jgi:hypothetical protein